MAKVKPKTAADVREQITKAKNDIRQSENHVKKLLQTKNHMERKVRTRRLIERGAILESLIADATELTNEQIKTLLQAALSPVVICNMAHDFVCGNAEKITEQGKEALQPTANIANETQGAQTASSQPMNDTEETQA